MVTAHAITASTKELVDWQDWSSDLFERAKYEQKFVILDLEAVWCHWCHVMDARTYTDPTVIRILEQHYIPVKVDHDARPDLANRYRDYGWPATIIFAPDGTEIVKRAGYIPPERMAALLEAVVNDPSPENVTQSGMSAVPARVSLGTELRDELIGRHQAAYDVERGGLRLFQKFLDRDSIEYAMRQGASGEPAATARARHTLGVATALIDPAWGGVYQYSTRGSWNNPHYEKLMRNQASYLRIYALALARYGDPEYLPVIESIRRYMSGFLKSRDGAFYVSQDADLVQGEHSEDYFALDDAGRRARGIPRVDTSIYAQENGWAIEALAAVSEVTGDRRALDEALLATRWIMAHHRSADGVFRHAQDDDTGPYLGDNLAMARAFLQLYRATAERQWLQEAVRITRVIHGLFREPSGGYTSGADNGTPVKSVPNIDENISLARFANLLFHYTGDDTFREMNEQAMRYLTRLAVATERFTEAGILLAADEQENDPLHLTITGPKDDPDAARLYETALRTPGWYKRIEWWDWSEDPMPNPDVQYPQLDRPAAFVCTNQRCSLPVFKPRALVALIKQLSVSQNDTGRFEYLVTQH